MHLEEEIEILDQTDNVQTGNVFLWVPTTYAFIKKSTKSTLAVI